MQRKANIIKSYLKFLNRMKQMIIINYMNKLTIRTRINKFYKWKTIKKKSSRLTKIVKMDKVS